MADDRSIGLSVPTECPAVPSEMLLPRQTWKDPAGYDEMARKLAFLFNENFKRFSNAATDEVKAAGPRV